MDQFVRFNAYKLFEFEYMLVRSGSRKQIPMQGRKIDNRVTLNFNKNLNRINQNLKLLISPPESIDCESFDVREHPLRRKTLHTASHKFIVYKNKENLNTINTQKQKRRKASPKLESKSLKKLINKSDTHSHTYSRLPPAHTRRKSKSPSSEKNAKSLSKQKVKHSKSLGRKSFSPQRTYKLQKSQPHKSKPVSAYTSRQTKSSYATTARAVKVIHTDRVMKNQEESPNSIWMLQPIKRRFPKKAIINGKPMLLDSESISMAKELQKMMEKNPKPRNSTLKPVSKSSSKSTNKLKPSKSKKVIMSQQTSKQKHFQSREQPHPDADHDVLPHRYRESYQPRQKKRSMSNRQKKPPIQDQLSMKTEYTQPTVDVMENLAALKIQKFWRGYQTRKQIEHYKKAMLAVVTIQRYWRGYLARKKYRKTVFNSNMPKPFDESLYTVKDFNESELKEDNSEERKISEASVISETNSVASDQPPSRENIRKMLDNLDRGNPTRKLFSSPKQSKQLDMPLRQRPDMLIESPTHILQTLPNLQKIHRQKLQHFSKLQKQALHKLVQQKLCSPRTLQFKSKEIDERLQYQIERFESGVREVMRGWNLTHDEGFLTPDSQSRKSEVQSDQNKKLINAFKNSYDEGQQERQERPIEDISLELSQYPEEEKSMEMQFMKFDSSLMFMEPYLAGLFSFLQSQREWKEEFLEVMKTPRNISIHLLLKNLACVTEESDEDNNFKLPLYKYLKYDTLHLISEDMLQDFHKTFRQLLRHTSPDLSALQQIHLRLIVDVLNEQLNRQRPTKKLLSFDLMRFSAKLHPSLSLRSSQDILLHNYFAYALQEVFKTASFLCGFIQDSKEIEQGYLTAVNECRMTQMINAEICRDDPENLKFQQEQIEAKVSLSEQIFLWLMQQAAEDIWTAYV